MTEKASNDTVSTLLGLERHINDVYTRICTASAVADHLVTM